MPVLLMTIGMILISTLSVPCIGKACLSGSQMLYMWSMTACVFPYVEYLHSMSCSCLLSRYFGSGVSWPLGFQVSPIARIRSGLWWVGLCCDRRIYSGLVCGWVLCVLFVVLEAFLLRVKDLWEL